MAYDTFFIAVYKGMRYWCWIIKPLVFPAVSGCVDITEGRLLLHWLLCGFYGSCNGFTQYAQNILSFNITKSRHAFTRIYFRTKKPFPL